MCSSFVTVLLASVGGIGRSRMTPAVLSPPWIPSDWTPTYQMNRSISLYWRNATGVEPAEFYDGFVPRHDVAGGDGRKW
jgi:hypothetical protein